MCFSTWPVVKSCPFFHCFINSEIKADDSQELDLKIIVLTFCFFSLFSGAWPVLIDEFVEYAKPKVTGKQTTV